jgi:hypothetical protein
MTTYRVSGQHEVLGHAPGETFDAELSDDQDASLVASGALERLPDHESSAAPAVGETEEGEE